LPKINILPGPVSDKDFRINLSGQFVLQVIKSFVHVLCDGIPLLLLNVGAYYAVSLFELRQRGHRFDLIGELLKGDNFHVTVQLLLYKIQVFFHRCMSCCHFDNFQVVLDGLNGAKSFIDSLDELGRKTCLHVLKFLL
jgi:hypothetical protein